MMMMMMIMMEIKKDQALYHAKFWSSFSLQISVYVELKIFVLLKSQPVNLSENRYKAYVLACSDVSSSHIVLRIGNHVFNGTINIGF